MAEITEVDYMAIPGKAEEMKNKGIELNTLLTKTYTALTDMHNNWYGKRYNSLIQVVNGVVPTLNEMLKLVVGQIPYALKVAANNYSQADEGTNACNAVEESPNNITDIPAPADVGMRFLTAEVSQTKQEMTSNFQRAEGLMNEYEGIFNGIVWESEAAREFKATFTRLKGEIISAFENIEHNFAQLMQQAMEDIQASETANTL